MQTAYIGKTVNVRSFAAMAVSDHIHKMAEEARTLVKDYPEVRPHLNGASALLRVAKMRDSLAIAAPKRKKLSKSARRKLSAGMRKYWARRKAEAAADTVRGRKPPKTVKTSRGKHANGRHAR